MDKMLRWNNSYSFNTVDNYHDFKRELFISLGSNLCFQVDYKIIISMLMYVLIGYIRKLIKLLPQFLGTFIWMWFNDLSVMENMMHMLTFHVTNISEYLNKSLGKDFVTILKSVHIVKENTGFIQGRKIMFAHMWNPFLGIRVCPLSGKHDGLIFPPFDEHHDFLNWHNYGNTLGVIGTNSEIHKLAGKLLKDCEFMNNPTYWNKRFPQELFQMREAEMV